MLIGSITNQKSAITSEATIKNRQIDNNDIDYRRPIARDTLNAAPGMGTPAIS